MPIYVMLTTLTDEGRKTIKPVYPFVCGIALSCFMGEGQGK